MEVREVKIEAKSEVEVADVVTRFVEKRLVEVALVLIRLALMRLVTVALLAVMPANTGAPTVRKAANCAVEVVRLL